MPSAGGEPPEHPPAASAPPDALEVYLAGRDIPCPHCHYNLRGVTAPACPECGRAIELQLAGVRRYWVPPIFMLLAFGWMLIAGAMNTYRNASYAWEAAHRFTTTFIGGGFSGGGVTLRQSITAQGGVTITTGPGGVIQLSQGMPGVTQASWSSVSLDIWIRLAWSLFLIIAAVIGLAVLWRHLSTPLSPHAWARARLFALSAFTIYAGFHLYWFAVEML